MDSLGRRVYEVDNRTFERELKNYFESNFQDRVSTRTPRERKKPNIVDKGVNVLATVASVVRFIFMLITLYLLYSMGRKLYEDMERAMKDENAEGESDAFDKMFGSEFKGKFKNARQNKGVFQARNEETRLKNLKQEDNTTPPPEVRSLLDGHDIKLITLLREIEEISNEQYIEGGFLKELAKNNHSQNLFRILYKGYTYRELISPRSNLLTRLKEATSYILECEMQSISSSKRVS